MGVRLHDVERIGWHWHPMLERWVRAVFGWDGFVLAWYTDLSEERAAAEHERAVNSWFRGGWPA